jgi:exonuclease VII small subunit
VKRASKLIRLCKAKLTKTEEEVAKVLEEIKE